MINVWGPIQKIITNIVLKIGSYYYPHDFLKTACVLKSTFGCRKA
jgi:hypothetical protein